MESQYIAGITGTKDKYSEPVKTHQNNEIDFESILNGYSAASSGQTAIFKPPSILPTDLATKVALNTPSTTEASSAYIKQASQYNQVSDWEKYKDDQLLSNPGGDHYYLEDKKVVTSPKNQKTFWGRIKKDLSDSFGNIKNFFMNMFCGAKKLYRDKQNRIRETRERGLVSSAIDFVKNLGSAFSFGLWRPDNEKKPEGFGERMGFFFSKIKEAVFRDMFQGVTGSVINMGEDLLLAGWNLVEVIPDATIGNFQAGEKLTTTIFDNGQVVIDYLTDILPTGEAWLRVHALDLNGFNKQKAPIYYNINMPEHYTEDVRWRYVRNTPFRKTIETIGSILGDVMAVKLLDDAKFFSEGQNKKKL